MDKLIAGHEIEVCNLLRICQITLIMYEQTNRIDVLMVNVEKYPNFKKGQSDHKNPTKNVLQFKYLTIFSTRR